MFTCHSRIRPGNTTRNMSKNIFHACFCYTLRHTAALSSVVPELTHAVFGPTDSSIVLTARRRRLCAVDISYVYVYMCAVFQLSNEMLNKICCIFLNNFVPTLW